MKKLNNVLFAKLQLQAEEAEEQGMIKLASNIKEALSSDEEVNTYSFEELKEDLETDLWKAASNVLKYYDLETVDAEKLDYCVKSLAQNFITKLLVHGFEVKSAFGPLEPKVPGEQK
jgi:hypothetical protein